jgi:WD40 repeat protein
MVHRDIKPSNLILSQTGVVKLLDLGIALAQEWHAAAGPATASGVVLGSFDYMAPEQGADPRTVDARADLYGLGCTLYHLVTGRPPFPAPSYRAPLDKIRAHAEVPAPPLRGDLPGGMIALISQLMAKAPADRPTSACAVADALAPFAADADLGALVRAGGVAAAEPESGDTGRLTPDAAKSPRRPRRRWLGTAALVAAALMVAAAGISFLGPSGTLQIETTEVEVESEVRLIVDQGGEPLAVHSLGAGRRVRLRPGRYHLTLDRRPELVLEEDHFELRPWSQAEVRLRTRPGVPARLGPPRPLPDLAELAARPSPADALDGSAILPTALPAIPPDAPARPVASLGGTPALHSCEVFDVAFNPAGDRLASAASHWGREAVPGEARVWDAATGRQLFDLKGHTAGVSAVTYRPDGRRLATAGRDKTVRIWDAATGAPIRTIDAPATHVLSIAYSPDGKQLAGSVAEGDTFVWDAETGKVLSQLPQQTAPVTRVVYSPDGTKLATSAHDSTARVWDVKTGKELLCVRDGHWMSRLAFSQDGKYLATASYSGNARVWDVKTGACLVSFVHKWVVSDIALRPDGLQVATACWDRAVRLWDARTGALEHTLWHVGQVGGVAYDRAGKRLATCGTDRRVQVWDVETGHVLPAWAGHKGPTLATAFSPDGRTIATGGEDGTVRLWDAASGQQTTLLLADAGRVSSVAFGPDGRWLAGAMNDGTARLWNVTRGVEMRSLRVVPAEVAGVRAVAFAPDGASLATAAQDGSVKLWNPTTGELTRTLDGHAKPACAVAFSPNGRLLASGSDDRSIKLWDTATGEALGELRGHTDSVSAVVFLPDGHTLASAGRDRTVRLWDLVHGESLACLEGHTQPVSALAVHPGGRLLASMSGQEGAIRLWSLDADAPSVTTFPLSAPRKDRVGGSIAFSPEGRYLAATTPNGPVILLRLDSGKKP